MAKRKVFYSFHYDNDVFRVMQIRNMGMIEENQPVDPSEWEEIQRRGDNSIKQWIDTEMDKCSCVIVLVGTETSSRPWVDYEIQRAWDTGKGLFGIYIHNLKDPRTKCGCMMGYNPFSKFSLMNGENLSKIVPCYNPKDYDAYNDIYTNIASWTENAIATRQRLAGNRL